MVRAPCSAKLAEQLRCKDVVFTPDGAIRSAIEGKISLSLSADGADFQAGQRELEVRANQIHKFKIIREEHGKAEARAVELFVQFRVLYGGTATAFDAVSFFVRSKNKETFSAVISAQQQALNFSGETEDDEEPASDDDAEE